ncbi:hypothetical protein [Novosphingobium olei]|uniref:Uncharacterized protein n=1 Tax=Novosphingobium olei TaxID=2728851 RepID=A0A7Y0BMU5_9SPHN|nr:hypothetical protein [Novosphingobium olei]NML93285.1 hypothetical protein [Novosphingobium olei]
MDRGYVCCFCGNGIAKEDYAALRLIATNLWEREAAQSVYAHSLCAEKQMAFGQLAPDALLDSKTGHSLQEIIRGEDEAGLSLPRWGCFVIAALIVLAIGMVVRAVVA